MPRIKQIKPWNADFVKQLVFWIRTEELDNNKKDLRQLSYILRAAAAHTVYGPNRVWERYGEPTEFIGLDTAEALLALANQFNPDKKTYHTLDTIGREFAPFLIDKGARKNVSKRT